MARLKADFLLAALVPWVFGAAVWAAHAVAAPDFSIEEYAVGDDRPAGNPPRAIPLPTRKPTRRASTGAVDLPPRNPVIGAVGELEKKPAAGEGVPNAQKPASTQHKAAAPPPPVKPELSPARNDTAATPASPVPAAQGRAITAMELPVRKPPKPRPPRRTSEKHPARGPTATGTRTREQQCAALRKCRGAFSNCRFSKKREETDAEGWEVHKVKCGEDYQKCIKENFHEGEMAFTRWFVPYDPCP